jgi:hypothetical protein
MYIAFCVMEHQMSDDLCDAEAKLDGFHDIKLSLASHIHLLAIMV